MTPEETIDQPNQSGSPSKLPTLAIDWELYGRYLDDSDLPEADKRLLIETLWSIVVSFVDLGFRLNPVDKSCESIGPTPEEADAAALPVLECGDTTVRHEFKGTAGGSVAGDSDRRIDAD